MPRTRRKATISKGNDPVAHDKSRSSVISDPSSTELMRACDAVGRVDDVRLRNTEVNKTY